MSRCQLIGGSVARANVSAIALRIERAAGPKGEAAAVRVCVRGRCACVGARTRSFAPSSPLRLFFVRILFDSIALWPPIVDDVRFFAAQHYYCYSRSV